LGKTYWNRWYNPRRFRGINVNLRRGRILSGRLNVREDWVRALPREKARVFDAVVSHWERSYAMMSVALDDAMSLRAHGKLVCAHQQLRVSVDLLQRLSGTLAASCEILGRRGRRLSDMPAVEPLRAEFFRGETGRSAASWNGVLHYVMFGGRSRFVQKVRILSVTLMQIEEQFSATADELSRGVSVHADAWKMFDYLHYDFNTCLREAEIVLKSFLRVLPADQLEVFAAELEAPLPPRRAAHLGRAFTRAASA
jgi:hypothetical protein